MGSLISIIVASYNKENFIADTIKSVINQDYENWELIIVDDFSTDSTASIVSLFADNDSRIKLFLNKDNKGANFCRNQGIFFSKGDYIIFLDADDILIESCLKNRLKIMQKERLDFCVFTMGTFFKKIGDSISVWRPNSKEPLIDFLKHDLPWSILQPIWKKDFLIKLGGFDESFDRLQDVELHTRALMSKNVCYYQINTDPDCYYRIDNERKNYNTSEFLDRWINASVKYYLKFKNYPSALNSIRYLNGTIYTVYIQIVYNYKMKLISKNTFIDLEKKLFNDKVDISFFEKILFYISKKVNLLPIRIPGFNYVMKRVIVL